MVESLSNSQVSINLRYLLWSRKVDRQQWPSHLAGWARCGQQRADALLRDGDLKPDEQTFIAKSLSLAEDDLRFADFIDGVNILHQNLIFLFSGVNRGEKKEIAKQVGVHNTTLSNWINGKRPPNNENLEKLCAQFNIPSGIDLKSDPVFLSLEPIGERAQKIWLHEHIDRLEQHTLQELFPALKKLLE